MKKKNLFEKIMSFLPLIGVLTAIITFASGYALLKADNTTNKEKVAKLETQVEDLKTKSTEGEVSDKYISEKVDKLEKNTDKIVGLLLEMKSKK